MTKAEKRAAAIQNLKDQAKDEGQPPQVDNFLTLLHDMLDSLERIAVALEKPAPEIAAAELSSIEPDPSLARIASALEKLAKRHGHIDPDPGA